MRVSSCGTVNGSSNVTDAPASFSGASSSISLLVGLNVNSPREGPNCTCHSARLSTVVPVTSEAMEANGHMHEEEHLNKDSYN